MAMSCYIFPIFATQTLRNMKRFLLILAVMSAFISAKSQENEAYVAPDTLTYQQLMADYVSLNNQVMQFRNYELTSIGLGAGAGLLAGGSYFFLAKGDNTTAYAMIGAAGALGVASLVTYIVGYTKIKRDRLEITPNGVVIKLNTPKQDFEPSLKKW